MRDLGSSELKTSASGTTAIAFPPTYGLDIGLSGNGYVYAVGETSTIYKISTSGASPIPMPTLGADNLLLSVSTGVASDLWVGGENGSGGIIGRIAPGNTGQLYQLNGCDLRMLTIDPSSGIIYASSDTCSTFEKIIY